MRFVLERFLCLLIVATEILIEHNRAVIFVCRSNSALSRAIIQILASLLDSLCSRDLYERAVQRDLRATASDGRRLR